MSKYTTEVRFICEDASGLNKSEGYSSIESIISGALPAIFNFEFPIFDEAYRTVLETKILKHYYTREICEETVGLWKLRLNTRLNEIMPFYNKLYASELLEFNPLYTKQLARTTKTDLNSNRATTNNGTIASMGTATNTGQLASTSNTTNYDLYSDTPQGALTGVDSETYLTNARKTTDANTTNSSSNNENSTTNNVTTGDNGTDALMSTEDYLESIVGYEGTSASDLLLKYRNTFLNIDLMIINELEDLFFSLW